MGKPSWRMQIYRALKATDRIGASSHPAKRAQNWQPGQAVKGIYTFGMFNTVFKQVVTFTTGWLKNLPRRGCLRMSTRK